MQIGNIVMIDGSNKKLFIITDIRKMMTGVIIRVQLTSDDQYFYDDFTPGYSLFDTVLND